MPDHPFAVHQFSCNLSYGDAISNDILEIQKILRRFGFRSEIFAQHVDDKMRKYFRKYDTYHGNPKNILLFHASIGCEIFDYLKKLPDKKILIYHNITPPSFFQGYNDQLYSLLLQGRRKLKEIRPFMDLAVGDSDFNRRELEKWGYTKTDTLPIHVDFAKFDTKTENSFHDPLTSGDIKNILFVGRISPNKCQHDIIKAFYFYHKYFEPHSRLILVGNHDGLELYMAQLQKLVSVLGLDGDVVFPGHISLDDLISYYRNAHLFLSMSEHEGFMVPLLESFHFGVPVLAYKAGAVPETMGKAGILFDKKDFHDVARTMDLLINDDALRRSTVRAQRERLLFFSGKRAENKLHQLIQQLR